MKAAAQAATLTENGSKTYVSTGSYLIDQFGSAGNYRGRDYNDVARDQSLIWDENSHLALRFPFYLRMITRKVKVNDEKTTEVSQKGLGARDEAFKRLLWISSHHSDVFEKNLWMLPLVGSWKDLWMLMFMDEMLGLNSINHKHVFDVMANGFKVENQIDLIKKYMPRIKSSSKCTTDWTKITNKLAKEFASYMNWSIKDYNHFKTSGNAHTFQKMICAKTFDKINWNAIPGRALSLLVHGKFLTNHALIDSYAKWLDKQPVAKFTGYVYELGKQFQLNLPLHQKMTIDKQFDGLIKTAKDGTDGILGNVWVACDTSGSMTAPTSAGVSAYQVCVSLGIFFSTLNEGAFHKNIIMFDNESRVKQLTGSFTEMYRDITTSITAWGGTNFNSIVEEIVRIRTEHPDIPLEDYPTTLLVVSDMEFNGNSHTTNYEHCKARLAEVFPKEWVDNFKFIWWDCTSRAVNFPTTMDDGGTYFFSGFDGSIVTMLLGGDGIKDADGNVTKTPSMEEMLEAALHQEILEMLEL